MPLPNPTYFGHLVHGPLTRHGYSRPIRLCQLYSCQEESWRLTRNGIDKLLVEYAKNKSDIDEKVLKSTLHLCRDNSEVETFLDAIPGYLWPGDNLGTRVANIGSLFINVTGEEPHLGQRIVRLFASCVDLDRRMDSDARQRRAITCARAIWEISRAFLSEGVRVDLLESASITLHRLSHDHDRAVAFAALCSVAMLERALLKQLLDSEGSFDSHRNKTVAMLSEVLGIPDPLATRYQGCLSNEDRRLTAVTEFISSILPVIPHMVNRSHEDLEATRRTLEELCDGLDGKTFTNSVQQNFVETFNRVLEREHSAMSAGTCCP
jgi:hypothetical protein